MKRRFQKTSAFLLTCLMTSLFGNATSVEAVEKSPKFNSKNYNIEFGSYNGRRYTRSMYMMDKEPGTINHKAYCLSESKKSPTGQEYKLNKELDVNYVSMLNNGYPRVSAEAMGLSDNEAVYATQMAIWAYIENWDINKIETDNPQILNKIVEILSKNVKDPKVIELDANLSSDRGNAIFDKDKLKAGPFTVTSSNAVSGTYTVSLDGAPSEVYVVGANGERKNTFDKDESFYVVTGLNVPSGEAKFKVNVNFNVLSALEYIPANDEDIQNIAVLDYVTKSKELYGSVSWETPKGNITITKVDAETKTPLSGAEFTIYDSNNKEVWKGTTDKDGKVQSSMLYLGHYKYRETKAPTGYKTVDHEFSFDLNSPNQNVTQTVENSKVYGSLTINKVDANTKEKLNGATFAVYKNNKEVWKGTTNESGQINVSLPYGSYVVKEVKAPNGYVLNDKEHSFDINDKSLNIKITIENDKAQGYLEIVKVDKDTKNPIANTEFGIFNINNEKIATVVTNNEGKATYSLPYGEYIVKETRAATGYNLLDKNINVSISDSTKKTITVENEKIYGVIEIVKVDEETKKPLSGAEFTLYSGDKEISKAVSDKNGLVKFSAPYGKYSFVETKAPEGYIKDSNKYDLSINNTEVQKFTVENKKIYGNLEIIKTDKDTKKPLSNVEFTIYTQNKEVISVVKTDDNGKINIQLPYGKYILQETKALEGYVLDNKESSFEIKDEKTISFEIENRIIRGDFELTKKDVADGRPLPNAEFIIRDANGNEVVKGATDENGVAIFKNLPYGKYTYQEFNAPEGYLIDESEFPFEIRKDGEVVKAIMTNGLIKGNINIIKVDKDTKKPLSNVEFTIYNMHRQAVFTGRTNADGKITLQLPYGKYILQETKTLEGYVLDGEQYVFEIKNDKEVSFEIENRIKKGTLELTKTDVADGKPLPNAEFIIRDANKNEVVKGKTDKNGIAIFENLPYGKYTYQEFNAPEGYLIDESEFPFEIKEDGEIVKANMTNELIKGSINITKVDKDTKSPIPNTEFTVYNQNDEAVGSGLTDENGKLSFNLPYGKYTVVETKAATGYVLNDKKVKVFIDTFDLNIDLSFENKKVTGTIQIIKVDSKTNDKLKNAEFELRDLSGIVIQKEVTNGKGEITFKDVPYGKYVIVETKAPEGYKLNSTLYSVNIEENNQKFKLEVSNDKIETPVAPKPTLPEAGGSSTIVFISLITLIGIGCFLYKKSAK